MKKVGLVYFIPLLFALTCLLYFNDNINSVFSNKETVSKIYSSLRYIDNFQNNKFYEDKFLISNDSSETIVIFGSSELNGASEAIPYNFISNHFKTKVIGLGHAGNQCFSIYSQLLANEDRLTNAPIVIILSPGWFESKAAKGTSSAIFLEYNSEEFLKTINKNTKDTEFTSYENKRISQLYNEFNAPNLELKLMNFKYRSSISIIHKVFYYPVIFIDNLLLDYKDKMVLYKKEKIKVDRKPILQEEIVINWDSLLISSKEELIKNSSNNVYGINNQYYTENIHGKRGKVEPVKANFNQELEDFKMLIKLLKKKKANVCFVMSPLNPLYCKNLSDLSPTIEIISDEIKSNNYNYLNLFETDTMKYDKAVLFDIMHMSKYGWYKINKFIVENYNLTK